MHYTNIFWWTYYQKLFLSVVGLLLTIQKNEMNMNYYYYTYMLPSNVFCSWKDIPWIKHEKSWILMSSSYLLMRVFMNFLFQVLRWRFSNFKSLFSYAHITNKKIIAIMIRKLWPLHASANHKEEQKKTGNLSIPRFWSYFTISCSLNWDVGCIHE